MARCRVCGSRSPLIASSLGACRPCIRAGPPGLDLHLARLHERTRRAFGLPVEPPRDSRGVLCDLCANQCRIPLSQTGYCGLRGNVNGRLVGGAPTRGNLSWYFDPLPTNCVADWVCPAGTGVGFPQWACRDGPEYGYKNLAVFNPEIPYSLLAFHPQFYLHDLPVTSRDHAEEALAAAKAAGLARVRIGNRHLLGSD